MKALIWVNFLGYAMAEAITLKEGDKSPHFDALDSKGERHNLSEILDAGQKVILYFYQEIPHLDALFKPVTLETIWQD